MHISKEHKEPCQECGSLELDFNQPFTYQTTEKPVLCFGSRCPTRSNIFLKFLLVVTSNMHSSSTTVQQIKEQKPLRALFFKKGFRHQCSGQSTVLVQLKPGHCWGSYSFLLIVFWLFGCFFFFF